METTKKLSEFIVKAEFEDIPKEGVEFAKQAFLDCVGVTLGGVVSPLVKIVIEMIKENGGNPRVAVIGAGFRTSPTEAALINGTSAHALDYDDTNSLVAGHPSVFLVPVVMALGEDLGISGIEALEAYVIGLETAARVGASINRGHYEKGWHATATLGTLGAAAAAAKILKLDTEQTRMAIGIAASMASGLRQNFGTMTKPLHAGNAARNGIVAAILAKRGFTADINILEAKFGFCKLFSRDAKFDLERITDNLGQPFAVITPGINIKPYPSCRRTHAALDAILELIKMHNISQIDVSEIEVRVVAQTPQILIHSNPQSALEGKFSMEFCMGVAVVNKQVGLGQFEDERVRDSQIQEMMRKVKIIVDPTLEDAEKAKGTEYNPSIVKVRLKNGNDYSKRVDFPKGNPEIPMNRDELLAKYRDCAGLSLSQKAVEQSIEMIGNLESVKDLRALADVLIG